MRLLLFFRPNSVHEKTNVLDQCTNTMPAVINSQYMSAVQKVCVAFKILMLTLLACERRINYTFT